MNKTTQVLLLVRHFAGVVPIGVVRQTALEKVNQPFIDRGGRATEVSVAQWCYRGLLNVLDRGKEPKQELLDLLGLAATWEAMSGRYDSNEPEWALLLFNSAAIHSCVIAAIRPDQ